MQPSVSKRVWNICLGNLFEHYDTALFGCLSPFLAQIIFPQNDPIYALILTYTIIPFGMLARPFGALVFGYIGDMYSRDQALLITLTAMGIISMFMGCIPTYVKIGALSPLLFASCRVLQNFFGAGETMGGAIHVLEMVPQKRQDLISSIYSSSAIGGYLIASLGIYITVTYFDISIGWRYLYLAGAFTAIFGSLTRFSSTPSISKPRIPKKFNHYKNIIIEYRQAITIIALCAGFSYSTFSIALVLMNGFVPLITSLSKTDMMKINTYLLVLDFCLLPVFGWIATIISREKLMLILALLTGVLAVPLIIGLQGASLATVATIRIAFTILGAGFFAPFHAWAQTLVDKQCRYMVISFGYAIGSQLLGGHTAALSLWCYHTTGYISSVAWYWMFLAFSASLSIMLSKKTSKQNNPLST